MVENELTSPQGFGRQSPQKKLGDGGGKLLKMIVGFGLLLLVLAGGIYLFRNLRAGQVDKGKYQAVFLSNGQVYFGKLRGLNSDYPTVTDIYYLVVRRPLQSQQPEATEAAEQQRPSFTLIKLGRELHGPVDKMVINRQHILFVEDLKEDGRVVQAIRQSQKQGGSQQQPQEQQPQEQQEGQ